jgi:probable addiction module antidote protein
MPKRTSDYHTGLLEELSDSRMAAQYLNAALEDSDEMLLKALRNVAEAKQMAKVAGEAGVQRESLYRMLCETGNPTYYSLLGIIRALKLRLQFVVGPLVEQPIPIRKTPDSEIQNVIGSAYKQGEFMPDQEPFKRPSSVKDAAQWRAANKISLEQGPSLPKPSRPAYYAALPARA